MEGTLWLKRMLFFRKVKLKILKIASKLVARNVMESGFMEGTLWLKRMLFFRKVKFKIRKVKFKI